MQKTLPEPSRCGAQDAVDVQSKQHCHKRQREMEAVSPVFERPYFRKLVDELPVIFGNFGNKIVFEMESGEELVEVLPGGAGW